MAHFIPIARALASPLLNLVYFGMISLPSEASEGPVRASSVGVCRSGNSTDSFGQQSCRYAS